MVEEGATKVLGYGLTLINCSVVDNNEAIVGE